MVAGRRKRTITRHIITHIVLIGLGIIFLLPFIWMLSTSLKPDEEVFDLPPKWIPEPVMWSNYPDALGTISFMRYAFNTVFITVMCVLGTLISTSLVGYSFARLKWRGRSFFFAVMLATMMLPNQVTLIPLFVMYKHFGWLDSFKPLIVPYFFGATGAFYIFLLRQFFRGIPNELAESAKMDGASHLTIFGRIVLPLSKPALATVGMFTFMAVWNDFLGPLIFLNDRAKLTLALGLRVFQQQYTSQWNLMMAASIVVILPTLIIFFVGQRYFIEGITFAGIKG
ncbi:MAG: carbohydrate ABC transporter permease [Spirochaetia bacterium]